VTPITRRELDLRRAIMRSFAASGEPPEVDDRMTLELLAARRVVVLDGEGRVLMAPPFAAHRNGTRVTSGGREWWGSCAWDGLGLVAALGLRDATLASNGIEVEVRDGRVDGDLLFHVSTPARRWWGDLADT
jgi:hypothetical protein